MSLVSLIVMPETSMKKKARQFCRIGARAAFKRSSPNGFTWIPFFFFFPQRCLAKSHVVAGQTKKKGQQQASWLELDGMLGGTGAISTGSAGYQYDRGGVCEDTGTCPIHHEEEQLYTFGIVTCFLSSLLSSSPRGALSSFCFVTQDMLSVLQCIIKGAPPLGRPS